jgi:hypothetical protein
MDMRFGTLECQSLYRSGFLKTVSRELAKYKLDLMGVQEVRWDKGGSCSRTRVEPQSLDSSTVHILR